MKNGINALVLGGTGVIGKELIKRLKKDDNTVTNISLNSESELADYNFKMDLSDMDLKQLLELSDSLNIDVVYYLATYSTTKTMKKSYLLQEGNILDLIIQAFDCSIRYASSYAVMDDTIYPKNNIKNEYRKAKQNGEEVVNFYADLDFDVVAFRIPAVYGGENNERAIYKIVQNLKDNKDIVLDKTFIEFCYVEAVIDSLLCDENAYKGIVQIPSEKVHLKGLVERLKYELKSTSTIIDNIPPTQSEVDFIEHLLKV